MEKRLDRDDALRERERTPSGDRAAAIDDVASLRATVSRLEHERAQAAAALSEARRDLDALRAELASFSRAVSHDLRAPLRHIDGFSLALEEDFGATLGEDGREHIKTIRDSVRHMGCLIDDLLGLARIAGGEVSAEALDLSASCHHIADGLRGTAPTRAVAWTIASGLTATGDRRLVEQALAHLLDNAWKFSAGSNNARIEVGFAKATDTRPAAVFIRDNGIGFDMRYADKLFRPGQRLHRIAEITGRGMGLAAVHRIAARHGGQVWLESEPSRGTTAFLSLPGLTEVGR